MIERIGIDADTTEGSDVRIEAAVASSRASPRRLRYFATASRVDRSALCRRRVSASLQQRRRTRVALERKTYFVTGSSAGGEQAAVIYFRWDQPSSTASTPDFYVHRVFERITDDPMTKINEVLQWNATIASQPIPV